MKKIFLLVSALGFFSTMTYAQDEQDAFILSDANYQGTARNAAMAGATSAIGADPSSMLTNPAGLGLYRSGDFSMTPSVMLQSADMDFLGHSTKDNISRFGFANISYINTVAISDRGLKSITFGVAYNKVNNFRGHYKINANNIQTSLLDGWAADLSNWGEGMEDPSDILVSQYPEAMAFKQFLISDMGGYYASEYEYAGYGQSMSRRKNMFGKNEEYDLSLAANVNDRLFFGLTIGLQQVRHEEGLNHEEYGGNSLIDRFLFHENYVLDGYGANVRIGALYRFANARVGVAYHSPTWMNLTNTYDYYLLSDWSDYAFNDQGSLHYIDPAETSAFDYKLRSPGKLQAGLAFQMNNFGFFSVDYEYIDYSKMKYTAIDSYDQLYYDQINDNIKATYKAVSNFKLGLELRLNPELYARAGYAFYGNPYNIDFYDCYSRQNLGLGIGYRTDSFYVDLTYNHTHYKSYDFMYAAPDAPYWDPLIYGSNIKENRGNVLLTFGIRL